MAIPNIPTEDLDIETLLGIAERVSPTGNVSLFKTERGWTCSFGKHPSRADLNYYDTPEAALVVAVTVPCSSVSG